MICTGSQGEPFSALSLMAQRQHKWVKLKEGDTVVLSSSLIPGNEPAIHRVVDAVYRTGADVYHMPADPVHASGHAAAEELRLMLSLVRPRWFIPVHGERRHLQHHARLAEEVGIPDGPRDHLRGRRRRRRGGAARDRRARPGGDDLRRRPRDRRRGRRGAARPAEAGRRRRGRRGGHRRLPDGRARERPRHREPRVRLRGDLPGHPRRGARARGAMRSPSPRTPR